MIRLSKIALISALLGAGLSADDFLTKATNGIIADDSFGVKSLDLAEITKVKGGYTVPDVYIEFANLNSAGASFSQVGKIILLSEKEHSAKALGYYGSKEAGRGYHAKQRYQEALSIADPRRGEVLSITASMSKLPTYWGVPKIQFGFGAAVLRVAPNGSIFKLRTESLSSHIASDAMRFEKNNLSRYLVHNY